MHALDPAIFDHPTATIDDLIQAARQQPSQAWRLYHSPVFVLKALRGELAELQARLGKTVMTELARHHGGELGKMASVSAVLTRGDLLAVCTVAHQVPARQMVTDALSAMTRVSTFTQLGACTGLLSLHPQWNEQDWETLASIRPDSPNLIPAEVRESVQALRTLTRDGLTDPSLFESLRDEEAAFLAVTSSDPRLLSVLSLHERASVMLSHNRRASPQVLAALALFGPPVLRRLMAERLRHDGADPLSLFTAPPPEPPVAPKPAPSRPTKPPASGQVVSAKDLL